jgi:hypothetical protein
MAQAGDTERSRLIAAIEKSAGTRWAAITVRWPLERGGEVTKRIAVYFAQVNDGDQPVAPKADSSRLLINAKEYRG